MRKKKILMILTLLLTAVTQGAWADDGIYCTASDVGRVVCTDGSIYDNVSAAEADGKTAVAMIAYLDTENNKGLALALADESDWMAWSTAISTCSAKTPTVTGGTWKLATKDEWDLMISAAGSSNALHDGFSSVGGTNMQWSPTYYYWSSTEYDSGYAWSYNFSGGSWHSNDPKENCNYVRACLAFDFNAPVTKMADNWYMISRQTQTRQSDWTALSAGSTTGRTLGSADAVTYYYATGDLSFTNSTVGGSGLTIQGTVYLYIPSGTTLTCTGANASGQTGAGAGIELTQGNSLYLIGGGTLNANGGNAANGGNGAGGNDAEVNVNTSQYILGGSGGTGGNGGGGAGAGIGTCGGNGGTGGTGGQRTGTYNQETTQYGVDGNAGSGGSTASAMGTVYKTNDITVNATGGSAGSNGTGGSRGKTASQHPGSNVYLASGGGGGGAGGFGGAANNIGAGGPGGGGGGGGAAGNVTWCVYSGTANKYHHAGACGGNGGQNADGSSAANGADVELDNPKHADIQGVDLRDNASDYTDDGGWEDGNGRHAGGAGGAAGSASVGGSYGTVTVDWSTQGKGTEGAPFIVSSTDDWNVFADYVNSGYAFSGEFVKLGDDISVSIPAGIRKSDSYNSPFSGTFLGDGHTITVTLTDDGKQGLAPFRSIDGATIKNLKVAGTIAPSQYHSAGIAGFASGTNTIEDCLVTATLNISSDYAGGIIGHGLTSATTIRGCAFTGTVNGVDGNRSNIGGIWGWSSDSATPTLVNCLEAGTYTNIASMHPMGLQSASGTITNCYYVNPQVGEPRNACTVSGAKQAYTAATTPANLGDLVKEYDMLTVYQSGVFYDGTYYVAPANVSLADNANNSTTISGANGYFADVTLTDRTLYKDGSWNTLCLPFSLTLSGSVLDGDNVDVRTLSSSSFSNGTLTLNFTPATGDGAVTELQAGTPYIIKWSKSNESDPDLTNLVNPVFTGVTVSNAMHDAETSNVTFKGTYSPVAFTANDKSILFLGGGNKLYYPASDMTMGAFRAYFQLNGLTAGDPNAGVRAFVLNFDEGSGESTGIISVDGAEGTVNGSNMWYTLDGRKLQGKPTQRGIYINNGKKTIIK
jgi:hypothetical protein